MIANGFDSGHTARSPDPAADRTVRPERPRGPGNGAAGEHPATAARQGVIALVDDHEFTRDCLVECLNAVSGQQVDAFASVEDCLASGKGPFALVLHYVHGEFGVAAAEELGRLNGGLAATPVMVVCDVDTSSAVTQAFAAGARGYLPSSSTTLQIAIEVIRVVRAGGQFAPVSATLLQRDRPAEVQAAATETQFTERQRAVLDRLVRGDANKVIAYDLGMSESTVKVHIRNIMRKMHATNRLQAVSRAYNLAHSAQG